MICIPITARCKKDALRDIRRSCALAEFIELRMDLIGAGALAELMDTARSASGSVRIIVTCRKKEEAAQSGELPDNDPAAAISPQQRIAMLEKAIGLGADYVDIELAAGSEVIEKLKSCCEKNGNTTKIIISYHNVKRTPGPAGLRKIFQQIIAAKPDVVKIVTYARTPADNLKVLGLITYARKYSQKIIALCMGEEGKISRAVAPQLGNFLSFAALEPGAQSAPGQFTAAELNEITELLTSRKNRQKMPVTPAAGARFSNYVLLGNPVRHSLSPLLHNTALSDLGMEGSYKAFCVYDLAAAIQGIRGMDIRGASITIPFKVAVMEFLDEIAEEALMIGAVNTLVHDNGRLIGYNTDWLGLMTALGESFSLKGKKFVIIGAGGTARAAVYGIIKEGGFPVVVNHTAKNGLALSRQYNCPFYALSDIGKIEADCLINTTPVGMFPHVDQSPVDAAALAGFRYVMDVIYNPVTTKLLKDAEKMGCRVLSGLDMFVHQAAEQFQLWTGKEPNRLLMKKTAVERLSNIG
jgi:shikimate dehydrogenase/3-dehydroquinate dehydratase type I